MLSFAPLQKSYGKQSVLEISELSLRESGRYALLGPNGSGKSTLLKLLAGQIVSDAGALKMTGLTKNDIAYLPQTAYAFDLSVLKNVLLPLGRDAAAKNAAMLALERVGLTELASRRASRLSGGERQRLALARVLAVPHKLLLLDEPTASVDIEAEERIETALLDYCAETGCTLLVSTHAPGQALRLCTDALVLDAGRLTEQGSVQTVFEMPAAESTKRFLAHWKG